MLSIRRVTILVAAARRGFEEAVGTLPPDLQTNAYAADVRKAILQAEMQIADLARRADFLLNTASDATARGP